MQNSPRHVAPSLSTTLLTGLLTVFIGSQAAMGQSASQTYRLAVPDSATVTTPLASELSLSADGATNSFPPQVWSLASTSDQGVVATFSIDEPFQHESVTDASMNASLDLHIKQTTGEGLWTSPISSATTSQSSGNSAASVRVESDGSGRADIELEVGFDNTGNAPAGKYTATLVFTIAIP